MKSGNDIITAQSVSNRAKSKAIIEQGITLKKAVFADGKLGEYAENIKPELGFYDVVMHGTSKTVQFFGTEIDSKTLSQIIKGRNDYNGEPIRLISCSTGEVSETANNFAQRLANELGVNVKAPNLTVYVKPNGDFTVGLLNEGKFVVFYPRK